MAVALVTDTTHYLPRPLVGGKHLHEVSLYVNTILVGGRVVRGIVEGDSIPAHFLPRLFAFWQDGRFPVERMMTFYDFDQINQAARDAEAGGVIKPVLRM